MIWIYLGIGCAIGLALGLTAGTVFGFITCSFFVVGDSGGEDDDG